MPTPEPGRPQRPEDPAHPALTVLVRTQGRRPETLRDAFVCLQGQTCSDFEVLVVLHDADPEGAAAAGDIVEALPASLRRRTRVEHARGGGRARPLNVGFAAAVGDYVACLDDDDLVFANWVEVFVEAARRAPGRLVRAVAVRQAVEPAAWPGGRQGLRTVAGLSRDYPSSFDLVAALTRNRTPFLALAFPRDVHDKHGVRFDESLDICEDWDFQLRAALAVGVTSTDVVTCVYRSWRAGVSSESLHAAEHWRRTEARIVAALDAAPLVLPPGSVGALRGDVPGSYVRELLDELDVLRRQVGRLESSRSWRLTRPLRAVTKLPARGWRPRRL